MKICYFVFVVFCWFVVFCLVKFCGIVHTLISLGLTTERGNACKHSALCYAVWTSLLAYSAIEMLRAAVRPWGGVLASCKVIKTLRYIAKSLCGSGFVLNNTFWAVHTSVPTRRNFMSGKSFLFGEMMMLFCIMTGRCWNEWSK